MNLVYIISAYRLHEQLVRLVTRLRTENATLLVHVDKKASPKVFDAIAEASAPFGPSPQGLAIRP